MNVNMNKDIYNVVPQKEEVDNRYLYELVRHADHLKVYIKKLTELTKHDFRLGKIDCYSYEHKINILTVMELPIDELKHVANRQLTKSLQPFIDARV